MCILYIYIRVYIYLDVFSYYTYMHLHIQRAWDRENKLPQRFGLQALFVVYLW